MKDVSRVDVKLGGRPVGSVQLTPDGKQSVFEYDSSWMRDGFSISPKELPLQSGLFFSKKGSFGGGFAAFEDSLPDGYGLYLLERMLRAENMSLQDLNPLQRLAIVGDAGMGALTYEPHLGKTKMYQGIKADDLDDIQEKALEILSEKTSENAAYLYYNSNNSGGARPKAIIKADDGSDWIVKFRHVYDPPDMGKSEYLYMTTARECGIIIPRISLVKDRYFAIERFDRIHGRRLHTLTASALLQADFRVTGIDYTNLLALTGYLTQDPLQVEQMYRLMCFNFVADNKDDHAKNFSFICDNGKWSLAPAYDLTYSPQGTNGEHATSVFYDGNPSAERLVEAGKGIRIPETRCLQILREIQSICTAKLPHAIKLI